MGRTDLLYDARVNDPLRLDVHHEVRALGPEWNSLFEAGPGVQSSRAWFDASIQAALPVGAEPHLVTLSDRAGPLALIPMIVGPGRCSASLTTPYTCLYQPLLRPSVKIETLTLPEIGRYCRRWPVTRFEALDPEWPGLAMLQRSFSSAGLVNRTFAHFGNWFEPIATRSWEAYAQSRPGALRETIKRRTRAAARAGARIEIAREGATLSAALAAYEAVYRRSWKEPEPHPKFNDALVRALAKAGVLRIGVMWSDGVPIAAQYWSVVAGSATILKLAHDEEFKALSPGTVLTAAAIREVIEVDGVTELDFGRGDDAYKRAWVNCRRPRIGLLTINPRTIAGFRALAEHDGGVLFKGAKRFFSNRLTEWRTGRPIET